MGNMNLFKYTLALIPYLLAYLLLVAVLIHTLPRVFPHYFLSWVGENKGGAILLLLFIIIFATFRITRLVYKDTIFAPYRDFVRSYIEKRKESDSLLVVFARILDKLINCPWCSSVWVSVLVLLLISSSIFGAMLAFLFAVSGIVCLMFAWINR